MNVLVTGGTGFVGRRVVSTLREFGHVVRLASRVPAESGESAAVIVGSIGPDTDWSAAVAGMDAVVHLAARVHVMRDHSGGAIEFQRTNTEGTLRLARAAINAGVRRFVFVSSIKVNGDATTDRPFHADDEPHPGDPYAWSKFRAEQGLQDIAGLEPVIIRPPLVHGPGAKGNLARFCRLALSGVPVPFAGIQNRRDLVGVSNLANLIMHCLTHPAACGQVFLASDGEALSTPELYGLICDALGRPSRMFSVPVSLMRALARPAGLAAEVDRLTQSLELDIDRTRELLDWEPLVSAASGIEEMARAYRAGER